MIDSGAQEKLVLLSLPGADTAIKEARVFWRHGKLVILLHTLL